MKIKLPPKEQLAIINHLERIKKLIEEDLNQFEFLGELERLRIFILFLKES